VEKIKSEEEASLAFIAGGRRVVSQGLLAYDEAQDKNKDWNLKVKK